MTRCYSNRQKGPLDAQISEGQYQFKDKLSVEKNYKKKKSFQFPGRMSDKFVTVPVSEIRGKIW